jgi:flagellar P-ring protein precursor FlgI
MKLGYRKLLLVGSVFLCGLPSEATAMDQQPAPAKSAPSTQQRIAPPLASPLQHSSQSPHKVLSAPTTRIKDIATFEGVRDNQLVGYGLVVGLQGTGDEPNKSPLKESLTSMLERLGVKIDTNSQNQTSALNGKNAAVVMVTATLPPFSRHGSHIDVTVSAMGNARSLLGGVLLPTPLMGADGETYVLAQGPLAVGGYLFGGDGNRQQMQTVVKGVPTNGRVPNGGIVEKEIPFELAQQDSLRLILRNPDFTTAKRISDEINKSEKKSIAQAIDSGTITIDMGHQKRNIVAFLTRIEQLTVRPDQQARIVFDERNGTIVINENVRIAPVAVAHGSLSIKITEQNASSSALLYGRGGSLGYGRSPYVDRYGGVDYRNPSTGVIGRKTPLGYSDSFPANPLNGQGDKQEKPHSGGEQTIQKEGPLSVRNTHDPRQRSSFSLGVPQWSGGVASVPDPVMRTTSIETTQNDGLLNTIDTEEKLSVLDSGATLQDLVRAINTLGCNPRDLITILQVIKQAGALQARLETI